MFVIVNVLAVAAVGAGLLHGAAASPAASSCHDSVCDIRSFGAVGDNVTVDTSAIQAALDAAAALPGGGTVLVSAPGVYRTGSIWLGNNTVLRIADGAALAGVPPDWGRNDTWEHYPRVYNPNTDGRQGFRHAALINAGRCLRVSATPTAFGDQCLEWRKVHNVTIEGSAAPAALAGTIGAPAGAGVIDGVGWLWWRDCAALCPDGGWNDYRPILMHLMWATDAKVRGLALRNSAFWNVVPQYARDVEVRALTITAPPSDDRVWPSHNTDGVDPQSSSNVLLTGLRIDTGDDCVAVSAGKDLQGRDIGIATFNVTVSDSAFFRGHGASVGSGTASNVSNVVFRNITMDWTRYGPRVKTQRGRGGYVTDILFENMTISNLESHAIQVNMDYNQGIKPTNTSATPHFANITIRNVRGTGLKSPGQLVGLPEAPIEGMVLTDVSLVGTGNLTWHCADVAGTFSNVQPSLAGCLQSP